MSLVEQYNKTLLCLCHVKIFYPPKTHFTAVTIVLAAFKTNAIVCQNYVRDVSLPSLASPCLCVSRVSGTGGATRWPACDLRRGGGGGVQLRLLPLCLLRRAPIRDDAADDVVQVRTSALRAHWPSALRAHWANSLRAHWLVALRRSVGPRLQDCSRVFQKFLTNTVHEC